MRLNTVLISVWLGAIDLCCAQMRTYQDILPEDNLEYNKMEPPKINNQPTSVDIHVTVLGLDSFDESSMSYYADIYVAQTWNDYRLYWPKNMTLEYRFLPVDWLNHIWRPDCFFKNAQEVNLQTVTVPNHYVWLYKNKTILYMVKVTLQLSCPMNFQNFPHDTQECKLMMESLSHTTEDLIFKWNPVVPLRVDKNIKLPQLKLIHSTPGDCTKSYFTGNFTCLKITFELERRLGYHLFNTYIPACLIVIMSDAVEAEKARTRAINIDRFSRVFFPLLFATLNAAYWIKYLK
ncbi:hypothetical protein K1T71_013392 [Dendrolimus kikuchii]|uniref:Uncharacterized protein n=1 Tax=Dendrolimus kikuchii TaxID=765133 RepID=A0ACC1CI36_9NEOP|nr:hypothetical protein K1T71_013392 [Dendrolimus kikuchii]